MTRLSLKKAASALLATLLAALAAWVFWPQSSQVADRQPLGLMTSLPLYWPLGGEMDALVSGETELSWVRQRLERRYEIVPLESFVEDTVAPESGGIASSLSGMERLLVVQPRAVGSSDNVALDQWVRDGGRLLYAIDPMLAGQYDVPWGDPAHPIVHALVPPVFARWGLEVQFIEAQPFALRDLDYGAGQLPVLMAGEFLLAKPSDDASEDDIAARGVCELLAEGTIARCQVGKGQVTAIADAALFELPQADDRAQEQFDTLIEWAFER